MNVQQFAASFSAGFSRDNRFRVSGTAVPPAPLNALVQTTSLPGLSYDTAPYRDTGQRTMYPYDPIYQPLQLTFIDTSSNDVQAWYTNWMREVYRPQGFNYSDNYKKVLTIEKLDSQNNPTITYKCHDCFPSELSPVQLTSTQTNAPSILTVNIIYNYFVES